MFFFISSLIQRSLIMKRCLLNTGNCNHSLLKKKHKNLRWDMVFLLIIFLPFLQIIFYYGPQDGPESQPHTLLQQYFTEIWESKYAFRHCEVRSVGKIEPWILAMTILEKIAYNYKLGIITIMRSGFNSHFKPFLLDNIAGLTCLCFITRISFSAHGAWKSTATDHSYAKRY